MYFLSSFHIFFQALKNFFESKKKKRYIPYIMIEESVI